MLFEFSNWKINADAVLFDLDGTLVDSSTCVVASWRTWALKHGLDPAEVNRLAQGLRTLDSIPKILPACDVEREVLDLEDLECAEIEGLVAAPGACQLLERLARPDWAIVTSCSLRLANHRIGFTRLPRPDILISGDDVSNGKPSPEGYLLAARKLDISPERCLVVEDSLAGVSAGKSAGMQVIAVAGTHEAAELTNADHVCTSIKEMADALR